MDMHVVRIPCFLVLCHVYTKSPHHEFFSTFYLLRLRFHVEARPGEKAQSFRLLIFFRKSFYLK